MYSDSPGSLLCLNKGLRNCCWSFVVGPEQFFEVFLKPTIRLDSLYWHSANQDGLLCSRHYLELPSSSFLVYFYLENFAA